MGIIFPFNFLILTTILRERQIKSTSIAEYHNSHSMVRVAIDQPHLPFPFSLPPGSSLATSDLLHHLGLHHGDVHHALVKQS